MVETIEKICYYENFILTKLIKLKFKLIKILTGRPPSARPLVEDDWMIEDWGTIKSIPVNAVMGGTCAKSFRGQLPLLQKDFNDPSKIKAPFHLHEERERESVWVRGGLNIFNIPGKKMAVSLLNVPMKPSIARAASVPASSQGRQWVDPENTGVKRKKREEILNLIWYNIKLNYIIWLYIFFI